MTASRSADRLQEAERRVESASIASSVVVAEAAGAAAGPVAVAAPTLRPIDPSSLSLLLLRTQADGRDERFVVGEFQHNARRHARNAKFEDLV
jgi:hypothetical protein